VGPWASLGRCGKFAANGIRSPDRPARSEMGCLIIIFWILPVKQKYKWYQYARMVCTLLLTEASRQFDE